MEADCNAGGGKLKYFWHYAICTCKYCIIHITMRILFGIVNIYL